MAAFARPENALKRADDLIAVGQKDHALQTLHDIITSKRNRMWSKVLEDIMKKYVQLCVDMRKGKFAKEGLHQYKIICQQVNVNSLEVVIKHYLQIAEGMAKEAQSKAKQTILDIEDLEAEESAESIILTAVSGEDRTDRTDREIVTPWLRFLWETYRTVLETLRNSAKLESLYHETAQQAFNFCLRYQRKNEFRRLSDILRNHLSNLGKYPNQPQTINLNNPETLQIHLETRFAQLNVATELELWQEAFRSVEDIHGLMTMAHKPLTAQMMANYFQKLARIFWVSNNYLFHAYAWFKYFVIARGSLKEKPEEFRTMATSVLLAALSIPLQEPKVADEQYFEYDLQKEKNLRMGSLLGFTITPKREFLLQDLVGKKVTQMVFPELQDIYGILEKRFSPLQLCQKMQQKFDFIRNNPALAQYEEQLQKLTFLRLIQQLSQVYESMKITDFKKMITFMDDHTIEKLLVNAVKRRFAGLRIDHQNGAIHFGGNESGSEQIRDQLTQLAKGLQDAAKLIHPKPEDEEARIKDKREAFVRIINSLRDEPQKLMARHKAIELRRAQEEERVRRQNELRKQEETRKQKAERDEAERKRKQEIVKRQKQAEKSKKQQVDEQAKKSILADLGVSTAEVEKIQDPQAFIDKQLATVQQQKREQEAKLTALTTELSHRERAHREVEKALLSEQLKVKKVQDKEHYDALLEKSITSQKQQHAIEVAEKQRLSRMSQARAVFEERVMGARRAEYEARKADQERRLAEIKHKREEEILRIQQEEEERRRRIEEEKRAAEEREQEKRRKEEEKKQEELEKKRKQQELIEIQRKREDEALRKRKEEEDALLAAKKKREEEEREKREQERKDRDQGSWRRPGEPPATAAGGGAPPAGGTWRRDERPAAPAAAAGERDRYVPPVRQGSDDRWGRDAGPRREDSWSSRDRPRDDRYRDDRDVGPRRDDSWSSRDRRPDDRDRRPDDRDRRPDDRDRRPDDRDRRPDDRDRRPDDRDRRPDDRDRPRDEPPRREDSWRRDDRDRPSRDEPPRRDDPWRRDDRDRSSRDEPRREDSRRDEPRREDSRRDEPRREDSRRDEPRREEPRREDSRRDDRAPAWGKRDDSEKAEGGAWRKPEPERREPERRESERRVEPRDTKEREAPSSREDAKPAPREEAKSETHNNNNNKEAPPADDGWGVVTNKRRSGATGRK